MTRRRYEAVRGPETSVVSERMEWLQGKTVKVTMTAYGEGEPGETYFTGVYLDIFPCGREYFFVFKEGEKRRLVRTVSVIEMVEQ